MSKLGRIAELGLWPRWLGPELASIYCQVAESTFHERVKAGSYPQGFKDGDLIQWDRHDLDEAKLALKRKAKITPIEAGRQSTLSGEIEAWTPEGSAR